MKFMLIDHAIRRIALSLGYSNPKRKIKRRRPVHRQLPMKKKMNLLPLKQTPEM